MKVELRMTVTKVELANKYTNMCSVEASTLHTSIQFNSQQSFTPGQELSVTVELADPVRIGPARLMGTIDPSYISAITEAWSAETSSDPNWSEENPALGNCAVTSLLIQDLYGGELLRGRVEGTSHYWNLLPGSIEVDLTRDQFGSFTLESSPMERERAYVLSFEGTAARYELLKTRVRELLNE